MTYNQYKNPKDVFKLILTALLEPFIFHPFVVWSAIEGNVDFLQKKSAWGEMTRQGFATKKPGAPASAADTSPVPVVVETPKEDTSPSTFTSKWLEGTHVFATLSISWLIVLLLFALFEVNYIGYLHEYPEDLSKMIPAAFRNAAFFWLKYNTILYLPFIGIYQLTKRGAKLTFTVLLIALVILQFLLIEYFSASLLPMGADLYGYTYDDIKETLWASGEINLLSVTNLICIVSISVYIITIFPKKIKLHTYIAALLPLVSLAFICIGTSSFKSSSFKSEFTNNIILNKSDFFLSETFRHFFSSDIEDEPSEKANNFDD